MSRKSLAFVAFCLAALSPIKGEVHLDSVISYFSKDNQPVEVVLQELGRQYQTSIVADPDVKGLVNTELYNVSLQTALDAVLDPLGFSWEVKKGYVAVHRMTTIDYFIEHPKMERSGSSQSSINLGSNSYSGVGGTGLSNYNTMSASVPVGIGADSGNGANGQRQQDQGNMEIRSDNKSDFWTGIEARLKTYLEEGEKLRVDRNAGIVSLTAMQDTHVEVKEHLMNVNGRVGEQVELIGEVVEVSLSNQENLGIDWNVAKFRIGEAVRVGEIKAQTTVTTLPGGFWFDPATITGSIGLGKVDVVISALREQGTVRSILRPRIRTGNNQTAYIKVAEDRPFFRLIASTTINTSTNGVVQPITQNQYVVIPVSIGNIFGVTPQVAMDGSITMDVTPTFTRLKDVVTSPDGTQTAPVLSVNQTATWVKIQDGETAIIGGLIVDSSNEQTRRIPILGDLPYVGRAFRSNGTIKGKSEIVIMLTARRVRPDGTPVASPVPTAAVGAAVAQSGAAAQPTNEAVVAAPASKPVVESLNLLK